MTPIMPGDPEWLKVALGELGVREAPGPLVDHPRILEYLSTTRLKPSLIHDEVPWCAAFVGWCLEQCGITGTKSAAARSYATYGIELLEPKDGCIVVLTRGDNPYHGHVGFCIGSDGKTGINVADGAHVLLLGGNQSNAVTMRLYPKRRILTYRWPEVS